MPIMGYAQVPTVQEQYVSALRQLIVLLTQQVNMLIIQLNAQSNQAPIPTIPTQDAPVYNIPMTQTPKINNTPPETIPTPPVVLPGASAPAIIEPVLLVPKLDVTIPTTIKKGNWVVIANIQVSNVDETIELLPRPLLVTITGGPEGWVPQINISFKDRWIATDQARIVKGQTSPIKVYLGNVPNQVGNITVSFGDWKFAGLTSGDIISAVGLPASTTVEIQE